MIHPRAIKKFLNRDVVNHNWIKQRTSRRLDHLLADYGVEPIAPLMLHQKAALYLGVKYPEFMFLLEMGCGKTMVGLELLRFLLAAGDIVKAIILVPTDEVAYGWEDEIKQWMPELPYCLLIGSSEEKWARYSELSTGIAIGTYQGISIMLSELVTKRKAKTRKYAPSTQKIKRFTVDLGCLILDESTKVASNASLWFAVCDKLAKACTYRYALVGRIFGRDPQQLWPQFYLIDRGASLGDTMGMFREAFFEKKMLPWGVHAAEYKFRTKMEGKLKRLIGHRSIRYDVEECIDLPTKRYVVKTVYLPEDADAYYNRMVAEIRRSPGNFRVIKNSFIRMRQISSGFLGFVDDEAGERAEMEFATNPKLDMLLDLLLSLRSDRQAVVFYEYTFSGRKICEALKREGVSYGWLYGGTKDSDKVVRDFKERRSQVLVANWRKSSFGLNLQVANFALYYESPVPAIERDQSERRVWRKGQDKTTFVYDLIAHGTVDARIREFHRTGEDLFATLVKKPTEVVAA